MKRKLTRKSLDELALIMPVLSEDVQRRYVGGGDGSKENPFTEEEYDSMVNAGTWDGGYVEGWGYTFGDLEVTGSISGSQNGVSGSYDGEWEDWDNDSGPQGGSGYWGDSGNYWGDTGNYFDDGYNTGVGGGSSGGGVYPTSNELKWYNSKNGLLSQAAGMYGIDLSDIKFKIHTNNERGANAWISGTGDERVVNLGDAFFKMSSNKQIRILIHEYFHIKDDKVYSNEPKYVNDVFLPEPPENIKKYIIDVLCEGDEISIQQFNNPINRLSDPQFYKNEINAYTKEKELNFNLTPEESSELDYRIWYYSELRKLADEYYYN